MSDQVTSSLRNGISTKEWLVFAVVMLLMATVLVADIFTTPDHVTICFIYAAIIFLSIFSFYRSAYIAAAVATLFSLLGSFINPPAETLSIVFFANRAIAIAAQWVVAVLVTTRKDAEALMLSDLEEQTASAETSRRFLDVLTHEIGTSLTTIDGQAFLLRRHLNENEQARASKIRSAVRHIQAIVQQVQLASEVGERVTDMRTGVVDLRRLVEDIFVDLDTSGISLTTDLSGLPETIMCDPDMVRQIVGNVMSNAIKYSPPGGEVQVKGENRDGSAVLTIADRGRGIAPDERELIFEPYYRARNSRGVHGAGIGLYVARKFVENHRGTIRIDGALDAGTRVTISLPVSGPGDAGEKESDGPSPLH
ncbi:HAMP domain-containing sensor histidine kinase [Pseudorhodoplanes sp.]|uniref:sensor histidine kinase n=1 Tax=Pseudorhodoplanes sp. TaxID=1934341 RepID=UPI002B706D22|nr:HAMP domain-containing sensor histidine kinase [Pseudorhodoplanes sp.]HWV53961.1 HAMP domain-containing sensor histidine kinase [Pseudorhodoplanes sp.]